MNEMTLREAMFTLRAMRRLKRDPVSEEDLRFLVEAATQAPSGENHQPWAFIVVRDADQRRRIGEAYRQLASGSVAPVAAGEGEVPDEERRIYRELASGSVGPVAAGEGEVPDEERRIYRNAWRLAERFVEIPALIVACMTTPLPRDRAWTATYYGSIFPAVQNLLLAARSRGLGTVLTTLHLLDEAPFKKILELPEDVHSFAIIPVGHPEGSFGPPRRRPVEEVTHWDRWQPARGRGD